MKADLLIRVEHCHGLLSHLFSDSYKKVKSDMVGGPVKPPAGLFLRIYGFRIFDELLLSEVPEQSGSECEAATLGKTDIRGSKSRMSIYSSWMTSL